jgi:hypothetical protein
VLQQLGLEPDCDWTKLGAHARPFFCGILQAGLEDRNAQQRRGERGAET